MFFHCWKGRAEAEFEFACIFTQRRKESTSKYLYKMAFNAHVGESNFFLVQHTVKPGKDMKPFWEEQLARKPEERFNIWGEHSKQGFVTHSVMPIADGNVFVYCIWEASPNKTGDDLLAFLDQDRMICSLGMIEYFSNHVMPINLCLLAGHTPPFQRKLSQLHIPEHGCKTMFGKGEGVLGSCLAPLQSNGNGNGNSSGNVKAAAGKLEMKETNVWK